MFQLDKAQFWANPFCPMFLLGWTWARFGLSHSSPAKTLAAAVAVLRTCVEDEALGGLMSPRLITDLDVLDPLTTTVNVGMVEVGTFAF